MSGQQFFSFQKPSVRNLLLLCLFLLVLSGCASLKGKPDARPAIKPVEEVLATSLAKTRLSSPFTDDIGGVRADGYQIVTILTYHALRDKPSSLMHVRPGEFEKQMAYLKENGYSVIPLKQFYEFIRLERGLPEKSVIITFDDGWRSVYTKAYPVLKKYDFPATIFIYTDFLNAANWRALTWEMMNEMSSGGVDIQVHSKTHEMKIPWKKKGETEESYRRRLTDELQMPKELTEKKIGKPVHYIAYPYGQYNDTFLEYVEQSGYDGGLTVFGATVRNGVVVRQRGNPVFTDPYEVNRVQILSGSTIRKFAGKLKYFHREAIYDGRYDDLFDIESP